MIHEIRKKQINILDEIYKLQQSHPNNYSLNNKRCLCGICNQIFKLGKKYEKLGIKRRELLKIDKKRIKLIISKGEYANKSDIEYLIDVAKMTKKEVAEMLNVPYNSFLEICKNWNVGRLYK